VTVGSGNLKKVFGIKKGGKLSRTTQGRRKEKTEGVLFIIICQGVAIRVDWLLISEKKGREITHRRDEGNCV